MLAELSFTCCLIQAEGVTSAETPCRRGGRVRDGTQEHLTLVPGSAFPVHAQSGAQHRQSRR